MVKTMFSLPSLIFMDGFLLPIQQIIKRKEESFMKKLLSMLLMASMMVFALGTMGAAAAAKAPKNDKAVVVRQLRLYFRRYPHQRYRRY